MAPLSVAVGDQLEFRCALPDAEAGETGKREFNVTCTSDGTFPDHSEWPICEVIFSFQQIQLIKGMKMYITEKSSV